MRLWLFLTAVLFLCVAASAEGLLTVEACGSDCDDDHDCLANPGNPCTFCLSGKCTPVCGLGCSKDDDCFPNSGNPCTMCNSRRVCVNPVPECGGFCGGVDEACRFNGTDSCAGISGQCCECHPTDFRLGCGNHNRTLQHCGSKCVNSNDCASAFSDCNYCENGICVEQTSLCGKVCSGSGQCESDNKCSQCVGYFCSEPAPCGQVCLSSGQCQQNGPSCDACVGTICTAPVSCGGACGGDDWCGGSCPVCGRYAKCDSSDDHEAFLATATEEELRIAELRRQVVREKVIREQQIRLGYIQP